MEPDKNVSDRIKISTNTFGSTIYARGDVDKLQLLRELVEQMDKVPEGSEKPIAYETPFVNRHPVRGIDLQLAYEVVSQLLAGTPDVKLATDETAKQLVLMGRQADHQLVKDTLESLAGEASDFKVINLQNLDTQMAIAAVKKFFGLADKTDPAAGDPVIDGDSFARQVWVKGSATQVRQIEELLEKLESTAKSTRNIWGDHMRMLPTTGSNTAEVLQQAEVLRQQVYGKQSPVINGSGLPGSEGGLRSRSLAPQQREKTTTAPAPAPRRESQLQTIHVAPEATDGARLSTTQADQPAVSPGRLVNARQEEEPNQLPPDQDDAAGAPIVIREGPGGLIVTSEDTEALDRFENLLRMMLEQAGWGDIEPEVIYLQNIRAAAAKQLLTDILSGTASAGTDSGGGGGLLGGMASGLLGGIGGGMLGSLLGGGGGGGGGSSTTTATSVGMASGTYAIVADPRLNALFVKAAPPDMRLIEQLVRVIDQVESPFSIETRGVTALIPVLTQNVTDVLTTVKAVFGDRIEGVASSSGRGGASGGGGGAPQNPGDFLQAMRAAFGGGASRGGQRPQEPARVELSESKIALGADTHTNTLIVVAQPYQIEEVRQLVNMLDEAGESEQEEVAVVELGAIASGALTDSLQRMLGPKVQTTVSSTLHQARGPRRQYLGGSEPLLAGDQLDRCRRGSSASRVFMQMLQGRGGTTGRGTTNGTGSGRGGR